MFSFYASDGRTRRWCPRRGPWDLQSADMWGPRNILAALCTVGKPSLGYARQVPALACVGHAASWRATLASDTRWRQFCVAFNGT
eukprot:1177352-Prorocentrum_minimum.AAC.3